MRRRSPTRRSSWPGSFGAPRPLGIALRGRGLLAAGAERYQADLRSVGGGARRVGRGAGARPLPGRPRFRAAPLTPGAPTRAGRSPMPWRRPRACGAEPLAEAARTELQATGARRRSGGSYDPDALTVAERRVCEMAAAGMRNREIAQALFVTRGTVESQLHAAYRKLAISSRGRARKRRWPRVDGTAA